MKSDADRGSIPSRRNGSALTMQPSSSMVSAIPMTEDTAVFQRRRTRLPTAIAVRGTGIRRNCHSGRPLERLDDVAPAQRLRAAGNELRGRLGQRRQADTAPATSSVATRLAADRPRPDGRRAHHVRCSVKG